MKSPAIVITVWASVLGASGTVVAQEPEVHEPAAGFGRVATNEELLDRVEALERALQKSLQQQSTEDVRTREQAAQMEESLGKIDDRLEALQEDAQAAQTRQLVQRQRALDRSALVGQAINSMQIADVALMHGQDDDAINSSLAAASVALGQLVETGTDEAALVQNARAEEAQAAVERARLAVINDDTSTARWMLAVAYAHTLAAQARSEQ